jgi:hypothetical protein
MLKFDLFLQLLSMLEEFSESSSLAFQLHSTKTSIDPIPVFKGPISMTYSSLRSPRSILTLAVAVFCLAAQASAACPEPASGKLAICQPSSNSTIFQVPHIEAVANPTSGSITSMKVFIDSKLVFQTGGPEISLFQGGVANGTHHLLVTAADSFGRSYQAQQSFAVTGNPAFSCPTSTVGVRICYPAPGQVISQNLAFSVGFKGNATISHVRAYVGSQAVADFSPPFGQPNQLIASVGPTTAGTHTLTIVAWDVKGASYRSSVNFKAFFEGGCPPRGGACNPGVYPNVPNDGDDVHSPFRVSASVQFNTASITAMKVYLDGAVAGTSSGPVFDQEINASKGTHIVVIQAWDTAGRLYRLTENVNVL